MSKLYGLYVLLGRLLWPIQLPLMRFFIKRTHRVYVLIIHDDKILLTKNWLSDGHWALPGGGKTRREDNETALKRELDEELGIKLKPKGLKPIASGSWQTHSLGFKYDIYVIELKPKLGKIRRSEIVEVAWTSKSLLSSDNTSQEILEAVAKI